MGYDPFSLASLAQVNVLCVPAGRITLERFEECVKTLQKNSSIHTKDIDFDSLATNGSFPSSDYGNGTIVFNFSGIANTGRPSTFPLELNADPQIVLGFIDAAEDLTEHQTDDQISESETSSGQTLIFEALKENFDAKFQYGTNLLSHILVVWDKSENSRSYENDSVIISSTQEEASIQKLLNSLGSALILGMTGMLQNYKDQNISISGLPISAIQSRRRENFNDATENNRPIENTTDETADKPSVNNIVTSSEVPSQSEKSKGRHRIMQGMASLQCGFWLDAIQKLSDGATIARNGSDLLWEARGIECLLICMLLCAWKEMGFNVPQICYSMTDKIYLRNPFRTTPPVSSADLTSPDSASPTTAKTSASTLVQMLPDSIKMILDLYENMSNWLLKGTYNTLLNEARIRLVNLVVFLHRSQGIIDIHSLDYLIQGTTPGAGQTSYITGLPKLSRQSLAKMVTDIVPEVIDGPPSPHRVSIMFAAADTLLRLGLEREHAFYLRDLLQRLAFSLIEARRIGASEMGIHPAAGLSMVNENKAMTSVEMKAGVRSLLSLTAGLYGAPIPLDAQNTAIVKADIARIQQNLESWCVEQVYGDIKLKLDMLGSCITVCEALPDISANLHLSSYMLRSCKQDMMVSPKALNPSSFTYFEQQENLIENINRVVAAASRLGIGHLRALYWDDFLVREIRVFEEGNQSKLMVHTAKDLSIRRQSISESARDPFIFNPFAKQKSAGEAPVLVAGETVSFQVLLQNPMRVGIEIEHISILGEGCDFDATQHSIVLGAYSSQYFILTGIPKSSGSLKIIGCKATMKNCYDQEFLIFPVHWQPPVVLKPKQRSKLGKDVATRAQGETKDLGFELEPPKAETLELKVIGTQPRVAVHSCSLTQPSLMLLAGEHRSFILELANENLEMAADLVLFTFDDNVTMKLREALSNKDLNSVDLYEIQHQILTNPSIGMAEAGLEIVSSQIPPGGKASYSFKLFGKAGLSNASILVDYAHLGASRREIRGSFYTRQMRFPLTITVNGSIEILRCNVLPMNGQITRLDESSSEEHLYDNETASNTMLFTKIKDLPEGNTYCMLVLDLRNMWPLSLKITLQAKPSRSGSSDSQDAGVEAYSLKEIVQPGHASRIVIPVPRLYITDPYSPVPSLGNQRQFVLSSSKLSPEAEVANRENFWYREELLKHIRGEWVEESTGRKGLIDLRKGVRLNSRMVDTLKIDGVEISFSIKPTGNAINADTDTSGVRKLGNSHFILRTEKFATVIVRIHNRTKEKLRLFLRLQPTLRNQPHALALDLSKRFAWSGVLQRVLHPALEPDGMREVELCIIAYASGEYELNASVEETKSRRSVTSTLGAEVPSASERRIWHARSPCLIDAIDK